MININEHNTSQGLKPFNINQALAGAQVVTRIRKPVRIICVDSNVKNKPIIALIPNSIEFHSGKREEYNNVYSYYDDGKFFSNCNSDQDLFLL